MLIDKIEVKVIKGDITQLQVDAIVNAANNKLFMGGGVAYAIKKKGGQAIEDEAVKKGPIGIGEAVATSAGKLSAKYIIHAATMGMDFRTDEDKIRSSCSSSLKLAEELKISSIAFPALGCGVGGFPLLASAKIMSQEVLKYARENKKTSLKEVIFCLYDDEAFRVFEKGASAYIEYVMHKLQAGPFCTVDAIIETENGIILVKRSNPPFGLALPGGFVDYGESLEQAVIRETKEETNLDITELKQFHTYSDPERDPRFHTIGTVFIVKTKGVPKAGDDAAELETVRAEDVEKFTFAFDHKRILLDYLKAKRGENPF